MIQELATRTRTTTVEEKLVCRDEPYPSLWWGNTCIASEDPSTLGLYAGWALRVAARKPPLGSTLSIIGAGTCVLPRLLAGWSWTGLDIYELDPAIIAWAKERWPGEPWEFIAGDWRETMLGTYDVLIYDASPEAPGLALLHEHLAPGGLLLGV